jgi:pyruvate kinase
MPNQKRTKIVATLGPATSDRAILKQMILEGVDVFRVNFSHANYDNVKKIIKTIRELGVELETTTAILGDLQGPKLRVGMMKEEVVVEPGDMISFCTGDEFEGNAKKVYMNYDNFPKDVKKGELVLLDDGKLMFEVVETNGKNEVKTKVIQGGPLRSKKGVNLPKTNISLPALTEKDKEDAIFAISQEVDWIALSFVRHAEDLKELRDLIEKHGEYKIPIIAKIEKTGSGGEYR